MKTLAILTGTIILGLSIAGLPAARADGLHGVRAGVGAGAGAAVFPQAQDLLQPAAPVGYDAGGGYGGYMFGDIATTPIQGINYGIAKIIRAQGDYNLLTSQALVNLTQAQRQQIENWRQYSITYYELRRLNDDYRRMQRGRPLTEAELARIAQVNRPRRLTPSELDTISGQVAWPVILQAVEFAPLREEVGRIFAERANHGVLGLDQYLNGDRTLAQMVGVLRKHIEDVPPADYMVARRFLESLAYELRFPAI